jgi:hypothetical protein
MKALWHEGMMPIQFLLFLLTLFVIFLAVNFFLKRATGKGVPMLAQAVLSWLATYSFFKFVIYPPIPVSLLYTYMGLVTIVIFLLVSATETSWTEFKRPIMSMLFGATPTYRGIRTATYVGLPILTLLGTYNFMAPKFEEPIELRTVHPAPPQAIKVAGQNFVLQTSQNPYRVDDKGDYLPVGEEQKYFGTNPFDPNAPQFMKYVREGGAIFFQNCHFCHGDNLNGQGMFSFAFNPIPANFTDPGTIAQLQETFVFWRVAKGGMGLPVEGFPWASVMPPWEQHLTIDEMWKVIQFEYWHTGYYPRSWD